MKLSRTVQVGKELDITSSIKDYGEREKDLMCVLASFLYKMLL